MSILDELTLFERFKIAAALEVRPGMMMMMCCLLVLNSIASTPQSRSRRECVCLLVLDSVASTPQSDVEWNTGHR